MPTLVVETGTGSATANSYCTRAFADAYFFDRGNTAWRNLSEDARDEALIVAATYLDLNYRWNGAKSTKAQALDWPQTGADDGEYAVDSDEIPVRLQQGQAEAALAEATIEGGIVVSDPNAGTIQSRTTKIGTITISKQYSNPQSTRRVLPMVDSLVGPLTEAGSGLERA